MDRYLETRVSILRPPDEVTIGDGRSVVLTKAMYAVVAEDVPSTRVAGTRVIGFDESGSSVREDDTVYFSARQEVRVYDLIVDGDELYEVQAIKSRRAPSARYLGVAVKKVRLA